MYSHRNAFPQEFGEYAENDPSNIFSCICASANTAPACIHTKLIPQEMFPACVGFVPGGMLLLVPPNRFANLVTAFVSCSVQCMPVAYLGGAG